MRHPRLLCVHLLVGALSALLVVACGDGGSGIAVGLDDGTTGGPVLGDGDAVGGTVGGDPDLDGAEGRPGDDRDADDRLDVDPSSGEDAGPAEDPVPTVADAIVDCTADACGSGWEACRDLEDCAVAFQCVAECGSGSAECLEACASELGAAADFVFNGLLSCVEAEKCFDAEPEAPADAESCEDRCGEPASGDLCGCDNGCVIFGDCCDDFVEHCYEEPTGPECGNGDCEQGETGNNCPADCGLEGPECGDGDCQPGENPGNCPEDCEGNGPECGDGDCQPGENPGNCPEDCEGNGPECGDGDCQPGENAGNCPEDCEVPGGGDTFDCLAEGCDTGQCLDFAGCTISFNCMADCDDVDCAEECLATVGGPALPVLESVLECGADIGCWEGGGPTGPVCGDGECEQDENADNCPEDCEGASIFPEDPLTECLAEDCLAELYECFGDAACEDAYPCLVECVLSGNTGCTQSCSPFGGNDALLAVGSCGGEAGCAAVAGQPWCGDGDCNNGETQGNCPDDCDDGGPGPDPGDAFECLSACVPDFCLGIGVCVDAVECMAECDDSECAEDCVAGLPDFLSGFVDDVIQCGEDDDCWDGGGGGNDPGPGDDEFTQCIEDPCEDELEACFDDDVCADAYPCLAGCVNDGGVQCTFQCMPDTGNDELLELGQCAGGAGCGNN